MNRLLSILLASFVLTMPALAQDKPQLPKVDPKIEISELETQLKTLEKDQLAPYADLWWAEVAKMEAEIKKLGAKKKETKGDESLAMLDEIQGKIDEREAVVDRLKVIKRELLSKGDEEKAKSLEDKISTLSIIGSYTDKTSVNELYRMAKNWVLSPTGGILWGLNILAFFAILIGARIFSNVGARVVGRTIHTSRMKASNLLKDFFVNTTRKTIFFAGVIMALGKIGIDIGPLLAGIGVMGFVVGFALQGTLSNFACGVMILLYRPYDVGDVVSAAGATGKVTEMSLVSTTLTTPDNQIVVIPNSSIWGGVITNITGNPTRRVDLKFGIGYGDDIAKAVAVLQDILEKHELVLENPAPAIQLHELGDSSVNFVVRPWSKTSDYWTVYWDVTRQVKERFDAEGISIPFPQRDVHHHGLEGLMENKESK